jgi:hypothetical protein
MNLTQNKLLSNRLYFLSWVNVFLECKATWESKGICKAWVVGGLLYFDKTKQTRHKTK